MKRSEFSRLLRNMEHVAELQLEAETPRQRRELEADYAAMSAAVRPYCTGEQQLDEDTDPLAAELELAAWAAAR